MGLSPLSVLLLMCIFTYLEAADSIYRLFHGLGDRIEGSLV